jgi:8-oxo-dGTP pyrophosphatase MutT (NUDIX family)
MKPWKILNSRYLLKRWWINLRVDHVELPNGSELEEFHVVEYPNWACTVCFTEAGDLVMVEQYRHAVACTSLECPAGAIDDGEEPLAAARRELLEETGYEADDWVYLGRCAPEPSKHTNFAYVFVALGARHVAEQELDQSESIIVRLCRPADVLNMAEAGNIIHGIHQAALFWAHRKGFLEG